MFQVIYVFLYQNLNDLNKVCEAGARMIYVFLYQNLNKVKSDICILLVRIYVFLYQNLNTVIVGTGTINMGIYVFLYQNLNLHRKWRFSCKWANLCISILEFKLSSFVAIFEIASQFMYFYIRI